MSAEWIDACRHPVVPWTRIHAAALTPLLLIIVWFSWITLAILVLVSLTMVIMQMKGREPIWVIRRLQSALRRGRVQAQPYWYRRRRTNLVSYDRVVMRDLRALCEPVEYGPRTTAMPAPDAKPTARRATGASRASATR